MKADSLPEEPNHPKTQENEESNIPLASEPSEVPLTSEPSSYPLTPWGTSKEILNSPAVPEPELQSSPAEEEETSVASETRSENLESSPQIEAAVASQAESQSEAFPSLPQVAIPDTALSELAEIQVAPETQIESKTSPLDTDAVEPTTSTEKVAAPITDSEKPATSLSTPEATQEAAPSTLVETAVQQEAEAESQPPALNTEDILQEELHSSTGPIIQKDAGVDPVNEFPNALPPLSTPVETAVQSEEISSGSSVSPLKAPLHPTELTTEESLQDSEPVFPNKTKRIFITGASGCIGHYIVETLIRETDHELYLLVRNPDKLQFDCNARPGISVLQGDMRDIGRFSKLLKTMDSAILVAAAWGGQSETLDINVLKPIQLLELLDPKVCQQVIYFSTASVLDKNNNLLKEAIQLGTDYIRTKADFLRRISHLPIAKRMTVLFPTLVLGGDNQHPYSHLSGGLPGLTKWIDLIRWFKADASFHFIHGKDIAEVVGYLINHPLSSQDSRLLVLGNPPVTVNQAVEEACAYLNRRIFFRLPLSPWLANLFIVLFNIQMSAWDRFCLEYQNFTYQNPVNPATFGLPTYCSTFTDVLKISGVSDSREVT